MPPTRGAAGRRDVRREAKTVGAKRRVQLVQHDARLDARPALRGVHLQKPVEVLRRVNDDAAADRLAGLGRAASSHRQRAPVFPTGCDDPDDVVARLHDHDSPVAGSGRRWRRWNTGREKSYRSAPRLRSRLRARGEARRRRLVLDGELNGPDGRVYRRIELAWRRHALAKSLHATGVPWTGTICDTFSFSFLHRIVEAALIGGGRRRDRLVRIQQIRLQQQTLFAARTPSACLRRAAAD